MALELAETLLNPDQAELRLDDDGSVSALNLALYRMSHGAALACEHARQVGSAGRGPATAAGAAKGAVGGPSGAAAIVDQRLRSVLDLGSDGTGIVELATVGQLARLLCLCLIDTYQARDRYDYAAMEAALDACDHWLPAGCTLKSFRVLECLRAVAQAGRSRDEGGTPPSQQDLDGLARLVSEDRNSGGVPHADHALLLLVTAIGHMQRRYLVEDVSRSADDNRMSLVDWALGRLDDVEGRGVAEARGWPAPDEPNPVAHHVHYYRHFAHHIKAMALAEALKTAAETQAEGAENIDISPVREEYRRASASLERALQLVPASNEARWRYYDLNAENLEHEESLRLELLEQRLNTRSTVETLAKVNVQQFSGEAKEDLRERMASVSMRIVEIIGVFLAVVAILGSTVASATVDDLSVNDRIVILIIGGTMPVIYFVLLRWIVIGRLWRRRGRHGESAR